MRSMRDEERQATAEGSWAWMVSVTTETSSNSAKLPPSMSNGNYVLVGSLFPGCLPTTTLHCPAMRFLCTVFAPAFWKVLLQPNKWFHLTMQKV